MQSRCPCCQHVTRGQFPIHVEYTVQCGNHFKALSVYLKNYQLIPYERQQDFWQDIYFDCAQHKFGHTPSVATLLDVQHQCYKKLAPLETAIKAALLKHLCCDESGLRVEGSGYWIHTANTPDLTLKAADVLPNYTGIVVHDGYVSYPTTSTPLSTSFEDCNHALCNDYPFNKLRTSHLRELTLMFETYGTEGSFTASLHGN